MSDHPSQATKTSRASQGGHATVPRQRGKRRRHDQGWSAYLVLGKPWALFVYKTPEYIHVIYVYAPAVSCTLCPKRLLSNHAAANPLGVYALSEIKKNFCKIFKKPSTSFITSEK